MRIPTLFEKNQDTVIQIYYGNASISFSTEKPTGVWDSNYRGVWHLKESGNGTLDEYKDSSQYANHGQGGEGSSAHVPTRVTGKIGYGQDFTVVNLDADPDMERGGLIDCENDTTLNITGNQITLEAWIQYPSATHHYMGPLNHKGYDFGYRLIMAENSQKMTMQLPGDTDHLTTAQNISTNAWHHIVATYDGTTMKIYIDGEKCLEAGMDDYLGKPFTVGQLRAILDKWLPRAPLEGKSSGGSTNEAAPAPAAAPQATGGSSHPSMAAIDRKILDNIRALQQSGAQGLLERVIQAYLQETPKLLDRIYAALKQGDADAARNAAHSLKSSSAHVGAVKLASLLKELEAMAKAAALNDSARMITAVSQEFGLVQQALHAELREGAA